MRLTLRTMLAYLDDILEPDDAQELGKKIEESEFASGLVHRIRSSMRRLRLDAPKLDGKGMALDPNTVAEYLDNTLPQDRVPDVEKVCLESDVHLAEVASCHQILTIVLGEPAEVSGELRQRIYHLAQPAGEPAKPGNGAGAAVPPATDAKQAPQPALGAPPVQAATNAAEPAGKQRDVPEYLRGKPSVRLVPLAITLALAFLVAALGLVALGGLNGDGVLWKMFAGSSAPSVVQSDDAAGAPAPTGTPAESAGSGQDAGSSQANDASASENDAPDTSEQTAPEKPADPQDAVAPANDDPADSAADNTAEPKANKPPADEASATTSAESPPLSPAADASPPASADQPAADSPAADAPSAVAIGRYISESEVLARFDAEKKTWLRVPQRAPLNSGDMLFAGPAYRPQILLASAIQITADGPTSLQLHEGDSADVLRLAIEFGRAAILTVGKAGAQIELVFGGRRGVATFGDAASEMAVEVRRYLPPGVDPETTAPQVVVKIFATSGHIEWRDGAAAPVQIKAGQVYRFVDELPPQLTDSGAAPKWIHVSETTIEDFAADDLETFLTTDRALRLSLAEKLNYRKNEVRSLAARMLAYLDDFEPIVRQFGDDQLHSFWRSELDSLRECASRSPATAAQVRQSFEKAHGDAGAELFRMVWGYDRAQFETGAAEQLVDLLDHPELPFRVLAFENLHRITEATHGYAAYFIESRRKRFVRIWRDRLAEGMVTYKLKPGPFDGVSPPAAAP